MKPLTHEGTFHAEIVESSDMNAQNSKAYAACFKFRIKEWFTVADGETEPSWCEYDHGFECYGQWWFQGKDGKLNKTAAKQLASALKFQGNTDHLVDDTFVGKMVQIDVVENEYDGRVTYKAAWLRPYGAEPSSGMRQASEASRKEVKSKHQSEFKALAAAIEDEEKTAPPVPAGGDDVPF